MSEEVRIAPSRNGSAIQREFLRETRFQINFPSFLLINTKQKREYEEQGKKRFSASFRYTQARY
jgi:hypothetical protein